VTYFFSIDPEEDRLVAFMMNDILGTLEAWRQDNEQIAIATVVSTWGSSPRPVGSKLAATLSGGIAGSVSAGCVEGVVIDACKEALESGQPRLLTFGAADEDAWEVGLACGGTIQVLVEPFSAWGGIYDSLRQYLEARRPMAVVSVIDGTEDQLNRKLVVLADGSTEGDLSLPDQTRQVTERALELLAQGTGGTLDLKDGPALFIEVHPPVPRLIIVGAVHIAELLVSLANLVGFDTVVVDPRAAFATRERFPHATQLVKEWPQKVLPSMQLDESAYVTVLTHDPKLDDPALQIVLSSNARYVGALGSRRTHAKRLERLRQLGLTEAQLARLHAPIGLRLGGRSPSEIALSIMAQVVQAKYGPHV
jgi:xanthine dehydrogenase accessory factor